MKISKSMIITAVTTLSMLSVSSAFGAESAAETAKKLANPVSKMISLPFQYNYDSDIGKYDKGHMHKLNIEPVIPFTLNEEWTLITRTIVPVVWQKDIAYDPISGIGTGSQSGFGSIVPSFFFSPKTEGMIWGFGPAFLLPTATNDLLGGDQWGAGPTAVALVQEDHWTYGGLFNHIWSFADDSNAEISNTFLQPFVSYITDDAVTFTLNTESTYDWEAEDWSVPINATVSKVTKVWDQTVSLQVGVRYWAVTDSDNSPEGWGLRLVATFIIPE